MKLAILGFLSCVCLCAQQASVEGTALDATTQAPLAGVHISLVSVGAGTNLPDPDDAYGAVSNAAGHYSIGNIRPGSYMLKPKRTGYVYVPEKNAASAPAIVLKTGEQVGGYRIAMTPEATIQGRVVDEFGDPVQGVGIQAVSVTDFTPYGLWRMQDETDDRGEYRISGAPGKYYIEASIHPLETDGIPEIRTDGSSTSAYATTYYPGSLAKERAKVVEAAPGQELSGIDIHVAHRKSLKISGVVTGAQAAGATVTILVTHNNSEAEDDTTAAADGSFAYAGLAPSDYWLRATAAPGESGGDSLQSPVVKVTVETDDATVTLPLTAGEEMAGSLQVEGDPPGQASGEQWTVRLTPLEPHGTPTKGGQVLTDGSFVIGRVIPGKYQAEVDPLPENGYIRSVSLGGSEAPGGNLDLMKGVNGSTMKVIVSRNGGQITGTIADAQGRRLAGRHLFVVLAGNPDEIATWRTSLAPPDATFVIHGIHPGKYRLFAIDPLQFGGLTSYEPLKEVAAQAEEVEIKEGDRVAKEIRVSGKEEAGAK